MNESQRERQALLKLALPIIAANLGWMALSFVDQVMLGRFDTAALAAASVANTWLSGTLFFGVGIMMGIDPLVTQAHGARDRRAAGRALQWALVVAVGAGALVGLALLGTGNFLRWTRQDPDLIGPAQLYNWVQIPSAPFFLAFTALRQYLQGREITRPALIVMILANVANALLNWLLIYEDLGLFGWSGAGLGILGAGIATTVTRSLTFVLLLTIMVRGRLFEGGWVPWSRDSFRLAGIGRVLRYGLPAGAQMSLEIWAFMTATLMAGWVGKEALAANAIVLNLASISYMLPLGIAGAASTRVGNWIGAGEGARAKRAAWTAIGMGGGVMLLSAVTFALFRHQLPTLYAPREADNELVLTLAASILPIAAAFQVFDGLQAVCTGILRGMGQTIAAAAISLVGYWILALPLAYYVAFEAGLGLAGVWWGLALGLALVAFGMMAFLRWRGPETVAKVDAGLAS